MKRLSEGFYPSLIFAIFIMLIMGLPGDYFPAVVSFWDWLTPDKIVHLAIFGIFSFITLWGYRNTLLQTSKTHTRKIFITTIIFTISYGALTEILQKYLFIRRYGCIYDFIADTIGCLLGIFLFTFYHKKKLKKIKNTRSNI